MIATAGPDGSGQVPGMLEQHRLGFQATGAKSPPEQRVVSVAVPAEARAASPDVARRDRAVHFGGELDAGGLGDRQLDRGDVRRAGLAG